MECFTKLCVCLVFVMVTAHGVTAALIEVCEDNAACQVTDGDSDAVCSKDTSIGGDSDGNCICTGKFKNNTDNNGCIAKVLGDDCGVNSDCTEKVNSVCSTEKKCACEANYIEESAACRKVLGGTCDDNTDCTGTVDNSECTDGTCECKANYGEEDAGCKKAAESSATSVWMTSSLLVTSMLIYIPRLFLW